MSLHQLEDSLKDIATKLSDIDKKVAILEYKMQILEEKFKSHENSVTQIKESGFIRVISKHWVNIPTIATILFGVIWLGNWIYDLPSVDQEKELIKLIDAKNKEKK